MAARETGDPGRVAGRERHAFRGRERGTSALDPKGNKSHSQFVKELIVLEPSRMPRG